MIDYQLYQYQTSFVSQDYKLRKTTRYDEIEVEYMDAGFKLKKEKFSGYTAQIIQHELDHVAGILI